MVRSDRSSRIQASLPFGRSGVGTPNHPPLTRSIQYARVEPNSVRSPTCLKTVPAGDVWNAIRWPATRVAIGKLGAWDFLVLWLSGEGRSAAGAVTVGSVQTIGTARPLPPPPPPAKSR